MRRLRTLLGSSAPLFFLVSIAAPLDAGNGSTSLTATMKTYDNRFGPVRRSPRKSWLALHNTGRFHTEAVSDDWFESLRAQMTALQESTGLTQENYLRWLRQNKLQHNTTSLFRYIMPGIALSMRRQVTADALQSTLYVPTVHTPGAHRSSNPTDNRGETERLSKTGARRVKPSISQLQDWKTK
jgi:hypothetical protein